MIIRMNSVKEVNVSVRQFVTTVFPIQGHLRSDYKSHSSMIICWTFKSDLSWTTKYGKIHGSECDAFGHIKRAAELKFLFNKLTYGKNVDTN